MLVNSLTWLALPENNLLTAAVNVNFATDPAWNIALGGSYTGVTVRPLSARVSNIANAFSCSVVIGTQTYALPPFTEKTYQLPSDANFIQLIGTTGVVPVLFYNRAIDYSQSNTDFLAIIRQVSLQVANFFVDSSGVANVVIGALTPSLNGYVDGTFLTGVIGVTNTGAAATLNIDGLGALPIFFQGGNPPAGAMTAGEISIFEIRAMQARLLNRWYPVLPQVTNYLAGDVALNNVALYFSGPLIALTQPGVWHLSGGVTIVDTGVAANFNVRLQSGANILASASVQTSGAGVPIQVFLDGYVANPAGNAIIAVKDTTAATGLILWNRSGENKDSFLNCIRLS